jgi:hypothetical protein
MAAVEETIEVAPDSELDRLLERAAGARLVLIKNGVRYRIQREDSNEDSRSPVDPERVLRVLDETAGSWRDVDVDRLIDDIYRWREEGSRSPERP